VIVWLSMLLLFMIGAVVVLFSLPIRVHVEFVQRQGDTDGSLDVRYLFGIVHLRRRLYGVQTTMSDDGPAVKATHGKTGNKSKGNSDHTVLTAREVMHIIVHWRAWVELAKDMWTPFRGLLRGVHIEQCQVNALVGTGDVVLTGVVNGSMWGIVSSLVGRMTYLCQFDAPPDVSIQPDFQRPFFETRIDCIARVRAGHAMLAGIRLALVWRRRKTNGTSHSGAHENGHGKHS
jgi:hypothetical protein